MTPARVTVTSTSGAARSDGGVDAHAHRAVHLPGEDGLGGAPEDLLALADAGAYMQVVEAGRGTEAALAGRADLRVREGHGTQG